MFGEGDIQAKQSDFDIFLDLFFQATENIESHYFQLPVAERENPVYRERVYCYELYHRIREQMPDGYPYKLDGELDKTGHPLIENSVGGVKPDFLVHERGRMDRNLIAIEVKPINATNYGIRKDMETLCGFLANARYFRAIYLIYGNQNNHIDRIVKKIQENFTAIPDTSLLYVIYHPQSGHRAEIIWTNR